MLQVPSRFSLGSKTDDAMLTRVARVLSQRSESILALRDVLLAWMAYSAVSRNTGMCVAVHGSLRRLFIINSVMHPTCVPVSDSVRYYYFVSCVS